MDQYTFNAAKFKEHASHLSLIEELAYRKLIDHYYITELPIELDVSTAARKIGLRDHVKEVELVLNDFFESTHMGWVHQRIEQQLNDRKAKAKVSRDNGQSGGRPKKRDNPEKTQQVLSDVNRIFVLWQLVMNKPKAKLTSKRRSLIESRLKEGYTCDQISMGVDGCALSPFHMGQNENGTKYNDITLICRDGAKLESFIERTTNPSIPELSRPQNGRKLSLAERTEQQTRELLSYAEAGQDINRNVVQNGAAFPLQVGKC